MYIFVFFYFLFGTNKGDKITPKLDRLATYEYRIIYVDAMQATDGSLMSA